MILRRNSHLQDCLFDSACLIISWKFSFIRGKLLVILLFAQKTLKDKNNEKLAEKLLYIWILDSVDGITFYWSVQCFCHFKLACIWCLANDVYCLFILAHLFGTLEHLRYFLKVDAVTHNCTHDTNFTPRWLI